MLKLACYREDSHGSEQKFIFKCSANQKEEHKRKEREEKIKQSKNNTELNKKVSSLFHLEKTSIINVFSDTKGRPFLRKLFPKVLIYFF